MAAGSLQFHVDHDLRKGETERQRERRRRRGEEGKKTFFQCPCDKFHEGIQIKSQVHP